MSAGAVVATVLRNKDTSLPSTDLEPNHKVPLQAASDNAETGSKYAVEGDHRALPPLKVLHMDMQGKTTKVEAKQEDLDMLIDAVYQALVTYHKRKVGYLQVCKYIFFTVVMMVMFMMQSQITADMHGQAQLIKETFFPAYLDDNYGFMGGRVPRKLDGMSAVYDFIDSSIVEQFPDPQEGDTVCDLLNQKERR